MKTPKQIAELIDRRTAGEDHDYFEIEVQDRDVLTQILGEVNRRYIETWGGEYYGCKEHISECTEAEIRIQEINSFNKDGDPIPPLYKAEEIEKESFSLTY